MEHLGYLFAGFAVFWAGIFAYLLWLQARLRAVTRQLERLEERLAEPERALSVPGRAGQGASPPSAGERTTTSG